MRSTEEKCFAVLISVWKTCNTKTSTNLKCHQMSKTTFLGGDPCTQHSHHNCWKGEPWSRIKGMSNDLEICIPEINKPRFYQAAEENSQDDKECVDMVALRMPFCLQIRFEYCSGTLALPSPKPQKVSRPTKRQPLFFKAMAVVLGVPTHWSLQTTFGTSNFQMAEIPILQVWARWLVQKDASKATGAAAAPEVTLP